MYLYQRHMDEIYQVTGRHVLTRGSLNSVLVGKTTRTNDQDLTDVWTSTVYKV